MQAFTLEYWNHYESRHFFFLFSFFFLISNIKILLKEHRPIHRKCTKEAKVSRNQIQETKLQRSSNTGRETQEKGGKTKHHSRRVKKKKRLKLKNGPFATLKTSRIPLPPDTPHQTMRHNPPYNFFLISTILHITIL